MGGLFVSSWLAFSARYTYSPDLLIDAYQSFAMLKIERTLETAVPTTNATLQGEYDDGVAHVFGVQAN